MRRALWFALAFVAVLALPRAAQAQAPQHCQFSFSSSPCTVGGPSAWRAVTFGPATFVKPAPARFLDVWRGDAKGGHRHIRFAKEAAPVRKSEPPDDCVTTKQHTSAAIFPLPCLKTQKK